MVAWGLVGRKPQQPQKVTTGRFEIERRCRARNVAGKWRRVQLCHSGCGRGGKHPCRPIESWAPYRVRFGEGAASALVADKRGSNPSVGFPEEPNREYTRFTATRPRSLATASPGPCPHPARPAGEANRLWPATRTPSRSVKKLSFQASSVRGSRAPFFWIRQRAIYHIPCWGISANRGTRCFVSCWWKRLRSRCGATPSGGGSFSTWPCGEHAHKMAISLSSASEFHYHELRTAVYSANVFQDMLRCVRCF